MMALEAITLMKQRRITLSLFGVVLLHSLRKADGFLTMSTPIVTTSKVADWDETEGVWKNNRAEPAEVMLPSGPVHVFGYGSLIWHPGPLKRFERVDAYLEDWKVVFAQKSTDHRGTPTNPGLVVTLVPSEFCPDQGAVEVAVEAHKHRVYGVLYKVPEEEVPDVLDYLDVREKGGYTQEVADVYPICTGGQQPVKSLLYKGRVDNPNFEVSAISDVKTAARRIATAVGPSGPNIDYFNALVAYLREIGKLHENRYMSELEMWVRRHEVQEGVKAQQGEAPVFLRA